MAEMVKIALDAMGGDNAPEEIVKGSIQAANENSKIKLYYVGRKEAIEAELAKYTYNAEQVEIVNATEQIETGEPPVMAIRKKKDSSMVKALMMVKEGQCDAYVSAGSTGATLVGGQILVGRIKGVERPPLAPMIPTVRGASLLLDCGANVDAKPSNLVQFAKMGSVYMKNLMGIERPTVGLLNIGAEEEKGNALVKEAYPLLLNCPDINFIGNVEAKDALEGKVDVIVSEAFNGNIFLKTFESSAGIMLREMKACMKSSLKTKIGGLLIKKKLKQTLSKFDASEYGGAPLLGLNGLVVKAHGSSKAKEIHNTCLQCVTFMEQKISDQIKEIIQAKDE